MILTCTRSDLLTALKRTGAAIDPNYTPTRASVLFHVVSSEEVQMDATDGTLGVALKLQGAFAKRPGRAMLPHKRLSALVTELPEGSSVEITVDEKFNATIKSPTVKRKFTMSGFDPEDFPPVLALGIDSEETLFSINYKTLVSACADVKQSIDSSRTDGALLQPIPGGPFNMVAVCSAGMSIAIGELVEVNSKEGVLLPRRLMDAASSFGGDKTIVKVQKGGQRIRLVADNCLITCSALYGGFPEWWQQARAAAPKERRFRASAERFVESVRAVSVAADLEGLAERFVQIDLNYKKGECVVSTRKSQKNYGEDELPVTEGSDNECVIHLDGQRLSAALRAAAPGEVDIFYDVVGGQEAFYLKSEAFEAMLIPIRDVTAPAPK